MLLSPPVLDQVGALLDRRCGLQALYQFGSTVTERATPASDLDLAALVARPPSALELLDIREDVAALVCRPVDLLVLNHTDPIVTMQVLQHGQCLLNPAPTQTALFEARIPSMYADLKRVRRPAEEALQSKYLHGW